MAIEVAKRRSLGANGPMQRSAPFDGWSAVYEAGAWLYSGGAIPASKRVQVELLGPGDRVLYLGAGAGEDAAWAARRGADVTCIDLSARMLARLEQRLHRAGLSARLLCGDALEHAAPQSYDAVAANYFLNCFRRDAMRAQLRHALTLLRPEGRMLIADVAPPPAGRAARWINLAYLKPSMALFWALGAIPWHENYDYEAELHALGFRTERRWDFRLLGCGPAVFRTLAARRNPSAADPRATRSAE